MLGTANPSARDSVSDDYGRLTDLPGQTGVSITLDENR